MLHRQFLACIRMQGAMEQREREGESEKSGDLNYWSIQANSRQDGCYCAHLSLLLSWEL